MNFEQSCRVPFRELAGAAAGFAALTVALTFPQIQHLSTHVSPHYDALFSIWRLSWIAHQLPRAPFHLFDANIFFPQPNTLAYSDAILLPGLIGAPAIWAGAHPVLVYNLLVLLSFVAAGVAMYFFVRAAGGGVMASSFAGAAFAFQPYRFAHYSHLELLWTCWIPLALWGLHRSLTTRRVRDGVLLGLFVALQAFSSLYYSVFLVTALAIVAVIVAARRPGRDVLRVWKPAVAAVLTAGLLLAPYAAVYLRSEEAVGPRTLEDVREWSPPLAAYTTAQAGHWLYPTPTATIDAIEEVLFPGTITVMLALVGVFSRPRRPAIAYTVLALVAFDLSLGLNGLLYRYLFELGGPYQGLRVPSRMFVIVSTALAVLAAMGISRIVRGRRFGWAAAAALLVLAVAETTSIPIQLTPAPDRATRIHTWLAQQPRGAVFEWPVPRTDSLGVTQEPRYMYLSTAHWQPLVNGYSGHYPGSYIRLLESTIDFPSASSIAYLRDRGVIYVVLHSHPKPRAYVEAVEWLAVNPGLTLQTIENTGSEEVTLYLLEPPRR